MYKNIIPCYITVISPSSIRIDYMIKLFKYRTAGVKEYWIVDPLKDRIMVYYFPDNFAAMYSFTDKIPVHIYDDLEIDFDQIQL